jgi:hypothetical protein
MKMVGLRWAPMVTEAVSPPAAHPGATISGTDRLRPSSRRRHGAGTSPDRRWLHACFPGIRMPEHPHSTNRDSLLCLS